MHVGKPDIGIPPGGTTVTISRLLMNYSGEGTVLLLGVVREEWRRTEQMRYGNMMEYKIFIEVKIEEKKRKLAEILSFSLLKPNEKHLHEGSGNDIIV